MPVKVRSDTHRRETSSAPGSALPAQSPALGLSDPDRLARTATALDRAAPADILALQRAAGNRVVSGLIHAAREGLIQRVKLTQEQERSVAEDVDVLTKRFREENLVRLFGGRTSAQETSEAQGGLLSADDTRRIEELGQLAPERLAALGFLDPKGEVPVKALEAIQDMSRLATMPLKHQMQVRSWAAASGKKKSLDALAKDYAIERHLADRKALHSLVEQGMHSPDLRTRNSCEFVRQVGESGIKLYALTPTHDAAARAKALTNKDGQLAYFGQAHPIYNPAGDFVPDPGVYYTPEAKEDDENIHTHRLHVPGFSNVGRISMISPSTEDHEQMYMILRHETQHVADRHPRSGGDDAQLESYKTEYRAYSLQGGTMFTGSMDKEVRRRGFTWKERQYQIFEQIHAHYTHTSDGWKRNPMVMVNGVRKPFRQAVVEFRTPASENPQNSVRVHKFLKALGVNKPNELSPALADAARQLQPEEKRMVLNNPEIGLGDVGPMGEPLAQLRAILEENKAAGQPSVEDRGY